MAKKTVVHIKDLAEPIAREVVKAIRDRQETLTKLGATCVREGQVAAAQKIAGTVKDLGAVISDVEDQLEPEVEGKESEEAEDEDR